MTRTCPKCGLISPKEAARCDCGYDFDTRAVERSYLTADLLKKSGGAARLFGESSRAHFRNGIIVVSLAAVIGVLAYLQSGTVLVAGAGVAGALYLVRGFRERRLSERLARAASEGFATALTGRLTDAARRAMSVSLQRAVECGARAIEPEHLLLAVLGEDIGVVGDIIARSGLSASDVPQSADRQPHWVPRAGAMPLSGATQRVLVGATLEADLLRSRAIGPEHLLLGLVREEGSVAAFAFARRGLGLGDIRAIVAGQ
jgi:hypothetical protein